MGQRVYAVDPNLRVYGGKELERGQVFELTGQRNDAKLLGHNALERVYCQPVDGDTPTWLCDQCGEEFVGDDVTSRWPQQHLKTQHTEEPTSRRVRRRQKDMTAEQIEDAEEAPPVDPAGASTETEPHATRMEMTKEGVRTVQRAPR